MTTKVTFQENTFSQTEEKFILMVSAHDMALIVYHYISRNERQLILPLKQVTHCFRKCPHVALGHEIKGDHAMLFFQRKRVKRTTNSLFEMKPTIWKQGNCFTIAYHIFFKVGDIAFSRMNNHSGKFLKGDLYRIATYYLPRN